MHAGLPNGHVNRVRPGRCAHRAHGSPKSVHTSKVRLGVRHRHRLGHGFLRLLLCGERGKRFRHGLQSPRRLRGPLTRGLCLRRTLHARLFLRLPQLRILAQLPRRRAQAERALAGETLEKGSARRLACHETQGHALDRNDGSDAQIAQLDEPRGGLAIWRAEPSEQGHALRARARWACAPAAEPLNVHTEDLVHLERVVREEEGEEEVARLAGVGPDCSEMYCAIAKMERARVTFRL